MINTLTRLFSPRGRIVLITLGILFLLDLGRSLYGRVGYATPVEAWQEAPYQALAWPPGSDLAADLPLGQKVYGERCALCHGPEGHGDGPAAPSQIPRPRDFTLGLFKYKSTPFGEPPTREDLIHVVENGLQASAMPFWSDILTSEEILAVVTYIQGFYAGHDVAAQEFGGPAPCASRPGKYPARCNLFRRTLCLMPWRRWSPAADSD